MKRDPLAWAALAAAIVVTASAEYQLARACGFGVWVAAGVPAALDIYAVRALRARRDVLAVVVAMIAVNAASHLVSAGLVPVNVPLVVAVSGIAPLVMWRVHALREEVAEALPEPGAEPRAELHRVPPVPPQPEQAPAVPMLGDFVPLLPLPPGFARTASGTTKTATGTAPDQQRTPAGAAPGRRPEPAAEPPEPPSGTSGTSAGTGAADIESADSANTAFRAHVDRARAWLAADPELTGTAIGERLGKSDGYGRRVRRVALAGGAR